MPLPAHHPTKPDYPIWRDQTRFSARELPRSVREWLLDPGSLTQRLIRASDGNFKVQLLCHHWQRPTRSEARWLQMGEHERAIVREVVLLCRGEPWVFARSIIPARSLTSRLRRLRKFQDSSLGELLFRDTSMRRDPFQVAILSGNSPFLPQRLHQSQPLWGRRCRFTLAQKPILVSEVFLPAFRP